MAQRGNQNDQEKFCCSICQDLLKDPVTIPCGHNYCMRCIKSHFDGEDQRAIYSCPLCRMTFITRPQLVKNTMLADLVEDLKKTGLQAVPSDHCYAKPGDVACDVCTGRKLKAVKSCLVCLVSYCEKHLQPHCESAAFENHKLVVPFKKLKERICSDHNEVMKMFCCDDQQCICYLCSMDKHKFHWTVSAEEKRTERQKKLDASLKQIKQRTQTREKEVKFLQQEEDAINQSADKTVEDCDEILNELIRLIKKRSSELKQQIRSEQKSEVTRAKEFKMKLEQEITELRRNEAELKELRRTEDHTAFLLSYPLKPKVGEETELPNINIRPLSYFEDVKAALSTTRYEIQQSILDEQWWKMSVMVKSVDVLLPKVEPKTRDEFLKYSLQMTLDSTTAHNQLFLYDKDRKVSEGSAQSFHLQKQERFIQKKQVLSRDSVTARCYWEVEWSGKGVSVAVAYKNIPEMHKSGFGNNSHSWALDCYEQSYEFRHDGVKTRISGPLSSRVGVYLDTRAGILSFYSVSGTMTLLRRVHTTFTEPLYGGLWIWKSLLGTTTARIIELE